MKSGMAVLLLLAAGAQAQHDAGRGERPGLDEAQWEQQLESATRAHHVRVAEALAGTGGARELALAVLLRDLATVPGDRTPAGAAPSRLAPRDAVADGWRRGAVAKAGDDIVANQLLSAPSAEPDAASRRAAAERWRAADSGNLVPLLSLGLPVDALLVEARRTDRADTRMYESVRWMASALQRHPPTADEQAILGGGEAFHADEAAALAAVGLWTATSMPDYTALLQACRGTALGAAPTRRADCRHVATLLADRSGSAADLGVGLAMLRELAASDVERAETAERQRRMHWQMQQWGRLASQQPRQGAAQFVRLLADPSIADELQLMERVLQEAGVPLQPPAGWSPPRY